MAGKMRLHHASHQVLHHVLHHALHHVLHHALVLHNNKFKLNNHNKQTRTDLKYCLFQLL